MRGWCWWTAEWPTARGGGALAALGINGPAAGLDAKREEWIYVYGQEDEPIVLDRFSPVLHLVQSVRDEAHRFAITFHRSRRDAAGSARNSGKRRHRPKGAQTARALRQRRAGGGWRRKRNWRRGWPPPRAGFSSSNGRDGIADRPGGFPVHSKAGRQNAKIRHFGAGVLGAGLRVS